MSSINDLYMTELGSSLYGPNPYSQFTGAPLPMPGYQGWPTDAMGNSIQKPPGMTLNSAPAPAPAASTPASSAGYGGYGTLADMANRAPNLNPLQRIAVTTSGMPGGATPINSAYAAQLLGGGSRPAQAPQPTSNSAGLSPDQYLQLLANPGNPATPGATVPQVNRGQGPSVLQQFLANQQGGAGAGNYSNKPFFATLNALQGGSQ